MASNQEWFIDHSSHIRIPKDVINDQTLSAEAKLIYGCLKDRTSLSYRNGEAWRNRNGDVYIYFTLDEVSHICACKKDKSRRIMDELTDAGLITRTRCGCGKPYQIVVHPYTDHADNPNAKQRKKHNLPGAKSVHNNTDRNLSDVSHSDSIHESERDVVTNQIRSNINYDRLQREIGQNKLDKIVSMIVDVICTSASTVRIAGALRAKTDVATKMYGLKDDHIRYLFQRLQQEQSEIKSIKGYVLSRLYFSDDAVLLTSSASYNNDPTMLEAIERMMSDTLL